jgi:chromosomal replication initiator protein
MDARSAKEIWEAALGELQIQVSKPYYRTWLEKTVGLSYQDNQFIVGVSNTFIAEYLEQNQRSLIEKTLIGLTHQDTKVLFQINNTHQDSLNSRRTQAKSYTKREENPKAQQMSLPILNPEYTFDSFIVGGSNRLAYAAALEIATNPGHGYNPLFIYGGAGLGKTHLLHAIAHVAQTNLLRVVYVRGEQFTNDFVDSIRQRRTDEFRSKYRSADMLLIDDIYFISGKEQTQESFFHTFNELHDANRQIAITSNRSPKSMPLLEDRLRSRFECGLIADIQPPDFETRLAILEAMAKRKGADISSEILESIAQQIQHNIRRLEGSLNRLIAYAKLTKAPLTSELAAQAIKDIAGKGSKHASITPQLVIDVVANNFQLSPKELKARKRNKEVTVARQVAMYLIRQETNCSLAEIGGEMGNRDHHIVSQAYKKIASDIITNASLRDKVLDIQQSLYSVNYP